MLSEVRLSEGQSHAVEASLPPSPAPGPLVPPPAACYLAVYQEVVLNEEDGMKSPCAVSLHHAVTVSQPRLGKRVAQLSSARMNEVPSVPEFPEFHEPPHSSQNRGERPPAVYVLPTVANPVIL
jgi:hypothetical protein